MVQWVSFAEALLELRQRYSIARYRWRLEYDRTSVVPDYDEDDDEGNDEAVDEGYDEACDEEIQTGIGWWEVVD